MTHPRHSIFLAICAILPMCFFCTMAIVLFLAGRFELSVGSAGVCALFLAFMVGNCVRWIEWRKTCVNNPVTRAGEGLRPFVEAMKDGKIKKTVEELLRRESGHE